MIARTRTLACWAVLTVVGAAGAAPAVAGQTPATTPPARAPTGLEAMDHEFWWSVDGEERGYLLHVPPAADEGRPLPVVLAFHGGGGNPAQFRSETDFDEIADREGFLVAYPFGNGPRRKRLLTWNAGECCGYAQDRGIDDVAFVRALLDHLADRTPVDRGRVFATGHSNGGMMAYRLAAEASDAVAAIVPVGGAMILDVPASPSHPTPLLHIHSVDDPRALYEGGLGPPFPFTNRRVHHRPVLDGLRFWAERNGCPAVPMGGPRIEGRAGTPNEGQTLVRLEWAPCATGAPVVHLRLTGAGHGWPGHVHGRLRERVVGPSTTLVNAAEEAWAFFAGVRPSDPASAPPQP